MPLSPAGRADKHYGTNSLVLTQQTRFITWLTLSCRQSGRSHYGTLRLDWTTRVPALPVEGMVKTLRRLDKDVLCDGNLRVLLSSSKTLPQLLRTGAPTKAPLSPSAFVAFCKAEVSTPTDSRNCLSQTTPTGKRRESINCESMVSEVSLFKMRKKASIRLSLSLSYERIFIR